MPEKEKTLEGERRVVLQTTVRGMSVSSLLTNADLSLSTFLYSSQKTVVGFAF